MTAIDRFDPFEQRITAAIDEIAAPRRPDYLDDILRQTARTSQRPRWTFPGRWLPVDTNLSPARTGRSTLRPLILVRSLPSSPWPRRRSSSSVPDRRSRSRSGPP